jgi:hypothetical protein
VSVEGNFGVGLRGKRMIRVLVMFSLPPPMSLSPGIDFDSSILQ